MDLQKKIEKAIKLLQTTTKNRGVVELAYSGGKDSDVCLELCKMANINFRAIYKCTTIDPSGTIAHAKSKGVEIVKPKMNMIEILRKWGLPNQKSRFCCKILKEYKILETVIIGVRKAESRKRDNRYTEPTQCRKYSKKNKVYQIMPILYWTDDDIKKFIELRSIKCHKFYYVNGQFDVKKRLGCQGCPLMSRKKRKEFFKQNTKWLKFWYENAKIYYDKRNTEISVDDAFCASLFYKNIKQYIYKQSGMFGRVDPKEFLENYFKIKL